MPGLEKTNKAKEPCTEELIQAFQKALDLRFEWFLIERMVPMIVNRVFGMFEEKMRGRDVGPGVRMIGIEEAMGLTGHQTRKAFAQWIWRVNRKLGVNGIQRRPGRVDEVQLRRVLAGEVVVHDGGRKGKDVVGEVRRILEKELGGKKGVSRGSAEGLKVLIPEDSSK